MYHIIFTQILTQESIKIKFDLPEKKKKKKIINNNLTIKFNNLEYFKNSKKKLE